MPKNKKIRLFKKKVSAKQWNNFYSKAFGYVFQGKTDNNKVIVSFWAAPDDVSEECKPCGDSEAATHNKHDFTP